MTYGRVTVECRSYSPLPDYYSGILWSMLMGTEVLRASSSYPSLRAYAHCSAQQHGAVTVLLINLAPRSARTVTLQGLPFATGNAATINSTEWHMTGPNGTASSQMALNGKLLQAKIEQGGTTYKLPPLIGRTTKRKMGEPLNVELAPASIAFVHLQVALAACTT